MKNRHEIRLIPATVADYPTIQNMARFYVYDMSEYMGCEEGWEIPSNGLYECIDFKHYFDKNNVYPFLIRKGKELAGFAIIDQNGSEPSINFNIAQFFIIRKFKGHGLGKEVAQRFFAQFRGLWEVMVLPNNSGAYHFWKHTIQDYTGNSFTEYTQHIPHLDNAVMRIFRFTSIP